MDLGSIAMKGYSAFPHVRILLEPYYLIVKYQIQKTLWGRLSPQQRYSRCILQPQTTGLTTRRSNYKHVQNRMFKSLTFKVQVSFTREVNPLAFAHFQSWNVNSHKLSARLRIRWLYSRWTASDSKAPVQECVVTLSLSLLPAPLCHLEVVPIWVPLMNQVDLFKTYFIR